MPHAPRWSWGRRRRSAGSVDVPHAAPSGLRQRVLGAARGEGSARSGPAYMSAHARWMLGASIAVLAAVLATALFALELPTPAGRTRKHSPAAITLSARTTHAHLRRAGSRVELVVSGMPEPPVGEVYEVWLDRPSQAPRPTDALFTVTNEGNGAVEVPGSLRGVREVTVTCEPLGGSSYPTTAPVLRLAVTQRD